MPSLPYNNLRTLATPLNPIDMFYYIINILRLDKDKVKLLAGII
jgi:hypothetical protein